MASIKVQDWPRYSPADQARRENVLEAAKLIMNAALTAPTAAGAGEFEGHILSGIDEQEEVARKMEELAYEYDNPRTENLFKYEAVMVREADAIIFLGDYRMFDRPSASACGMCAGRPNCSYVYENRTTKMGLIDPTDRRRKNMILGPCCTFRYHALGFAVGSALWMASQLFVDARAFMTVGVAGQRLGYCPNSVAPVGILLAAQQKNPFWDIYPDYHLINMERIIDKVRELWITQRMMDADYRVWDPARRRVEKEEEEE